MLIQITPEFFIFAFVYGVALCAGIVVGIIAFDVMFDWLDSRRARNSPSPWEPQQKFLRG